MGLFLDWRLKTLAADLAQPVKPGLVSDLPPAHSGQFSSIIVFNILITPEPIKSVFKCINRRFQDNNIR